MTDLLRRLLSQDGNEDLSYDQAKELASHKDPAIRRALAARRDIAAEILYFLAGDEDPEIRRLIALNESSPKQANLLLAEDENGDVRGGLASKISTIAPELDKDERNRLMKSTYQVLEALARDQVPKVRQILAEALKDVADAPADVIQRLARDSEVVVAAPVLEFSPVLTDADFLEIACSGPASGILSAISRRAEVSEDVADAITATQDEKAITFLLANETAQIREETLDSIIERAPSVARWHAPLVRRPKLHASAAVRLAQFVADNLLFALKSRKDLESDVLEQVAKVVECRIKQSGADEVVDREALINTFNNMSRMKDIEFPAEQLIDELNSGRYIMVLAGLAFQSKVSPMITERILACGEPEDIMALSGLARMPPSFGETLQETLGKVPKENVTRATQDGNYPMHQEEMSWRISCYVSRWGGR